jgi:hypothetical protein
VKVIAREKQGWVAQGLRGDRSEIDSTVALSVHDLAVTA